MAGKRKLARTKSAVSSDVKELRKIERLLGEDFDTLAQARRALKRESKPITQKAYKVAKKKEQVTRALAAPVSLPKLPSKKSYTIKELNGEQRRKLTDLILDKNTAIQLNDKLLKPGEQWGGVIPYDYTGRDLVIHKGQARTFKLYSNLEDLFKEITRYITYGLKQKATNARIREWLSDIKVVRWGSADKTLRENRQEWKAKKDAEVVAQNTRRKAVSTRIRKAEQLNVKLQKKLDKYEGNKSSKKATKKGKK